MVTFLVLALKVLFPEKSLRPGQIRTVGHPIQSRANTDTVLLFVRQTV